MRPDPGLRLYQYFVEIPGCPSWKRVRTQVLRLPHKHIILPRTQREGGPADQENRKSAFKIAADEAQGFFFSVGRRAKKLLCL